MVVTKLLSMGASVLSISEPSYSLEEDDIKENSSVADYVYMLCDSLSSARLAEARRCKAQSGNKPCGAAPYGYMWNGNEIVVNDAEAETLKLIFQKYLKLSSLSKLEDYLVNSGHMNRNNRPFKKGSLANILKNDFYIGIMTYQGQKNKGQHMPLIDEDEFSKVNLLLARNMRNTKI